VLDELCRLSPELRQACNTVSNSCYVDDCIDSRDSKNDIVSLAKQLPELLQRAGMKICKMYTNNPGALSVTDPELGAL
jgi:hypothetical protein